jgi:hypothetical protein
MLNPFHTDKFVANSESDSEMELVSVSGQLPFELKAQSPEDVIENLSDNLTGPHLQDNGPVTVKHDVTVKAKDDVEALPENLYQNTDTITPQPPEGVNPKGKYTFVIQNS